MKKENITSASDLKDIKIDKPNRPTYSNGQLPQMVHVPKFPKKPTSK